MNTGLHLQKHEVDNPPASTAKVRDGWNHIIAPLYVFITLRIINYRDATFHITSQMKQNASLLRLFQYNNVLSLTRRWIP